MTTIQKAVHQVISTIKYVIQHPPLRGDLGVLLVLLLFSACSKEETEATEWDNWQARNEAFFASLSDSLETAPTQWRRIKCFSLDPETEGDAQDYVYVKVLQSGTGTESPLYTDSVRTVYRGRLIPTATYPEGYVFDETVYGKFSLATGSTSKMLVSATVDGFSTALQQMHRGDYWRVYIPSDLGYGASGSSSGAVLGYSTIVFDLLLVDFSPAGEAMAPWSSRQKH